MKVIIDFTIVPLGVGVSLSKYVAACENLLRDTGLTIQLHANGTNIEGTWDEVFDAVKKCHELVHEMGAPRVTSTVKVGTRTDKIQTMNDKIESVQSKMSK